MPQNILEIIPMVAKWVAMFCIVMVCGPAPRLLMRRWLARKWERTGSNEG